MVSCGDSSLLVSFVDFLPFLMLGLPSVMQVAVLRDGSRLQRVWCRPGEEMSFLLTVIIIWFWRDLIVRLGSDELLTGCSNKSFFWGFWPLVALWICCKFNYFELSVSLQTVLFLSLFEIKSMDLFSILFFLCLTISVKLPCLFCLPSPPPWMDALFSKLRECTPGLPPALLKSIL